MHNWPTIFGLSAFAIIFLWLLIVLAFRNFSLHSKCPQKLNSCVRVCVCVFVWLSPTCSELIWFDWFARIFSMPALSAPIRPIGHLALWLFCFIHICESKSEKVNCECVRVCLCVCVCVCLSLIRVPILYMRKVFKACNIFSAVALHNCLLNVHWIGNCFAGLRFLCVSCVFICPTRPQLNN